MRFETGLEFGRHAAMINEAYAKMSEAYITPHKDDGISMEHDYKPPEDALTADDLGMNNGYSGFTRSNYEKDPIPSWLRAEAERHGHKFADDVLHPEKYETDDADTSNVQIKNQEDVVAPEADDSIEDTSVEGAETADTEDEVDGDQPAEDNFYENIVLSHPEDFNDETYNMDEVAQHKMEIMKGATDMFLDKGVDMVEAVKRVLKDIPGCEKEADADMIGNIDDEAERA